jgi:hypothetical protein
MRVFLIFKSEGNFLDQMEPLVVHVIKRVSKVYHKKWENYFSVRKKVKYAYRELQHSEDTASPHSQ